MSDPQNLLKRLQPEKEFCICIDSDGCVFDSMEIKHKECFCPAFINHFGMQPVSKFARETWEFVNLYSKTRGCNRFLAVEYALNLLAERTEVKTRNVNPPAMGGLRDWIKRETKLGNPALEAEVAKNPDPDLTRALAWSTDVNDAVRRIVRDVPPFPGVKETLEQVRDKADVLVVSQTPGEALEREWAEHKIDRYVRVIAGQELGTKTEHIQLAAGGKYPAEKILMLGDAPGDAKAAEANSAFFFPINPGHEEASWQNLLNEGLDRFFSGTFGGDYQIKLLDEFDRHLPEQPPWA